MASQLVPDRLSHYTSIESLHKILKSKALRLKRLDLVDDVTESTNLEYEDFAKLCFTSSWTDAESDNLMLWNMYGDQMRGVKITLPKFPFKMDEKPAPTGSSGVVGYCPFEEHGITFYPDSFSTGSTFLFEVEYDPSPGERMVIVEMKTTEKGRLATYRPENIGKYKHTDWKGQHEYRYRFMFSTSDILWDSLSPADGYLVDGVKNLSIDRRHLDLKLDTEALRHLQIETGPKCSEEDDEVVRLLCKEYLPSSPVLVQPSKWRNKIRG